MKKASRLLHFEGKNTSLCSTGFSHWKIIPRYWGQEIINHRAQKTPECLEIREACTEMHFPPFKDRSVPLAFKLENASVSTS